MPRILTLILCLLLIALTAVTAVAEDAPRDTSADPGFEVLLDGGLALPLGNLGAGLPHTATGMGAEPGYRAGLRGRYTAASGLTVSPCFMFTEFGDHDGFNDLSGKTGGYDQKFKVQASQLRYGLDLGYLAPGGPRSWRSLMSVGVGVVHQRYREELVDAEVTYTASAYDFAWLLSVGVRRGPLELVMEYHGSRLTTDQFFLETPNGEYNWSYLALRAGYALPRF